MLAIVIFPQTVYFESNRRRYQAPRYILVYN